MSDIPTRNLSIVVVGASGDLARRKIFPALFALYCQGLLPEQFHIFGFARSRFSDAEFQMQDCREPDMPVFARSANAISASASFWIAAITFREATMASIPSWTCLWRCSRPNSNQPTNRLYYLAIPPPSFLDVAHAIGDAGLVSCGGDGPWSRVVLEKPFGRDRESSDQLTRAMAEVFVEEQTYRIDHYLGKEVIQNLLVLRFANLVFEPIWHRDYIQSVQIDWKEDLSLEGRGGYFDQYGIIRDVMQNHLVQILALVAMEPPRRLDATCIAAEKVKTLRSIPPLKLEDLVIGQYGQSQQDAGPSSRPTLTTPRFPTIRAPPPMPPHACRSTTPDGRGVPFLVTAGKGLDARMTEIRIQFRDVPATCSAMPDECPEANELVIRVQPDESIYLSLVNKVPGMDLKLETRNLDLQYKAAFSELIPDAYESLILDVIRGDQSLFIRSDELRAAWDIFTPALHAIEQQQSSPNPIRLAARARLRRYGCFHRAFLLAGVSHLSRTIPSILPAAMLHPGQQAVQ